jgi:hypothetical protein
MTAHVCPVRRPTRMPVIDARYRHLSSCWPRPEATDTGGLCNGHRKMGLVEPEALVVGVVVHVSAGAETAAAGIRAAWCAVCLKMANGAVEACPVRRRFWPAMLRLPAARARAFRSRSGVARGQRRLEAQQSLNGGSIERSPGRRPRAARRRSAGRGPAGSCTASSARLIDSSPDRETPGS